MKLHLAQPQTDRFYRSRTKVLPPWNKNVRAVSCFFILKSISNHTYFTTWQLLAPWQFTQYSSKKMTQLRILNMCRYYGCKIAHNRLLDHPEIISLPFREPVSIHWSLQWCKGGEVLNTSFSFVQKKMEVLFILMKRSKALFCPKQICLPIYLSIYLEQYIYICIKNHFYVCSVLISCVLLCSTSVLTVFLYNL